MYRIDNSTAAEALPAPAVVGPNPNGYFTGGNPGITPATIVDADWANAVQEEIANAVIGSGQTLSKTNRSQLSAALAGRLLRTTIYDRASGVQIVSVDGGAFSTSGALGFTSLGATNRIEFEVQGAGGASAGSPATSSTQSSCGGNGADGSYLRKTLLTGFSGGIAVVVGAGGAAASGANGGAGGQSSFGAYVAAGGGGGSIAGPSAAATLFAVGGTPGAQPTAGDLVAAGQAGNGTLIVSSQGVITVPGPAYIPGHGVGGLGTANPNSAAVTSGNSGENGCVIVREYS